jgi:hypothetical protein
LFPRILEHPFFASKPRLQRIIELIARVIFTKPISLIIGATAVTLSISAFFKAQFVGFIGLGIIAFFVITVLILILVVALSAKESYRICNSSLSWVFPSFEGNLGSFTLAQEVVFLHDTQVVHSYFGLDEFIEKTEPEAFLHQYEGKRKKIIVSLGGYFKAGKKKTIKYFGRRNVNRAEGNTMVDIPIDFPTEKQSITLLFNELDENHELEYSYYERFAGEIDDYVPDKKKGEAKPDIVNGIHKLTVEQIKPIYGKSYLISWRKKNRA